MGLIVLNNDAVVCEDCYEPQVIETDPGLVPFGRTAYGTCSRCGRAGELHPSLQAAADAGDRAFDALMGRESRA